MIQTSINIFLFFFFYIFLETNLVQNRISHFLPTYSENEHLTNSFSSNADFEKVCSKCPHYCTRMQLFPIFILPGLHWFRLRKLIRKLMYPVFCAKIPLKYSSAVQVAQSLIKVWNFCTYISNNFSLYYIAYFFLFIFFLFVT